MNHHPTNTMSQQQGSNLHLAIPSAWNSQENIIQNQFF
jgi:hypothetical protein